MIRAFICTSGYDRHADGGVIGARMIDEVDFDIG
jgi:hypothetical protein